MPRLLLVRLLVASLLTAPFISTLGAQTATPAAKSTPAKKAPTPPPITAKPEELAKIKAKTDQLDALVAALRSSGAKPELVTDVAVYAHAGRMLLEVPDMFTNQGAIDRAFTTLDQGLERAKQLQSGQPQWLQGKRRIHAYTSALDGAVLPYGIALPENYDPAKPTRLYVWLHGRSNTMVETEFIHSFLNRKGSGNPPVADHGQIQLDCFGRINGAGWHWAGEADVWESIAAVKQRYNIDEKRIILRGFSQGGMGAWHISLHHPDRFAAAEIGAGTVSRTAQLRPDLQPFQLSTLRIWENISEWALNIHNLPLVGHDGEHDTAQLESSLRARAQLEKEGYPSVGDPDFLRSQGAPGLWLISKDTGHSTSPLTRQRIDAFLKEHGDRGQSSPDHIRFLTYTTRYNRSYWVTLDRLAQHYERAEVDARRLDAGTRYEITTKNLTRLTLRETDRAREVRLDGETLKVTAAPALTFNRIDSAWTLAKPTAAPSADRLHKQHALQGPIDDAFLDPFLIVLPTGQPWNAAVHDQSLRTLARFQKMWARFFRGHPFIKKDTEVTNADFAKYHVVLFGDPGSNAWIAKLNGKLPVTWTKQTVTLGGHSFPAAENYPALIYPNPLHPTKYVVLNSGLTINDRGYNGDYGTPEWGDYAIVKATASAPLPDLVLGGLFDEHWQLKR